MDRAGRYLDRLAGLEGFGGWRSTSYSPPPEPCRSCGGDQAGHGAEWERARLRKADLRGSELSGLSLAVLADYAGVMISDSEQAKILRQLGVDVPPS